MSSSSPPTAGSETKIHGPMESSIVVEGGRRERNSGTDSFRSRAFRGNLRDPIDGMSASFRAVVVFDGRDGGASALCWMVVRRRGWISDQ